MISSANPLVSAIPDDHHRMAAFELSSNGLLKVMVDTKEAVVFKLIAGKVLSASKRSPRGLNELPDRFNTASR